LKLATPGMKPMALVVTAAIAMTTLGASGASADADAPRPAEMLSNAVAGTLIVEDTVSSSHGTAGALPSVESTPGQVLELTPGQKDQAHTDAVPAVIVAAAAWCAKGAIASVPTTALSDILAGKASSRKTYVTNAIVSCFVGELGGVAWRYVPGWAKQKAIHAAIALLIRWRN
jgi:hypothetical protein